MSLEDQIRAMGDARAASVSTPSWRDTSPGGRGRRLLAAAAATVLVVGVVVVLSTRNDEAPDVDTANSDVDPAPSSIPPTTLPPASLPPTTAPTTSGAPPITAPPATAPCATNPEPSAEFLDTATHIAFDRTPLDLDQDGINDEMLIHENDDGTWSLVARLQSGWTEPVALNVGTVPPRLLQTPDGVPAGTDLDGDGFLEFFLMPDTTMVTIVSLSRCDAGPANIEPYVLVGLGEWCLPGGCAWRISCPGEFLLSEITIPGGQLDDHNPDDIRWVQNEVRLIDETFISAPLPYVDYPPDQPPTDAPTEASTGVVDCTPPDPDDVDRSVPTRPECAGNAAPPASATEVTGTGTSESIDIDQDGNIDGILAYTDEAGDRWLTVDLGDGYTAPIPVFWRGTSFKNALNGPLAITRDGSTAAYDFDGDGTLEFFLTGFGNTARSVRVVSLTACALQRFGPNATYGTALETSFDILVGVGGYCPYVGCRPRVSCANGQLIVENTDPLTAWDPELSLADVEVSWTTTIYELRNGNFEVVDERETTFFADQRPADAPHDEDSDVVDCAP